MEQGSVDCDSLDYDENWPPASNFYCGSTFRIPIGGAPEMSVGKYSPTITAAYHKDQDWFKKNGGDIAQFDNDGYNMYGYNRTGKDRAGYEAVDYLLAYDTEYDIYDLYEAVDSEWTVGEDGRPKQVEGIKS
jgi:hypothetical protein